MLFKHNNLQKAVKLIQKFHTVNLGFFLIASIIKCCWRFPYIHTSSMLQWFLGKWKSAVWMCTSSSYV